VIPKDLHIPGYEIEVMLGKGGMAAVYQARQQSFGREVALKVLNPAAEDLEDFSQRFLRESLIVARLHHSHIVQVYDVGQHENYFYISMEYLHGGDLANKIREGITLRESVRIIKQLADALDFAHRKNIIHRDIKPENIMFREDGAAVLTDFGIAKELESQSNLTQTGLIIGTPRYMSPEHIRGEEVDHRADIYALGIVFYRCLTNYVPFDGKDMVTTAYLQNNEPVPTLPPEVACFQEIVNRMLEKDPNDRFQRGGDIVAALEEIDRSAYPGHLTNLDVAEASKLSPPTVTRTASGRHSVKVAEIKPEEPIDPQARSEGTQIRARVLPNETIRADHMTPAELLLDLPLEESAQVPPGKSKAISIAVLLVFICLLASAGYVFRDELRRGAWSEVIAGLQNGLHKSWVSIADGWSALWTDAAETVADPEPLPQMEEPVPMEEPEVLTQDLADTHGDQPQDALVASAPEDVEEIAAAPIEEPVEEAAVVEEPAEPDHSEAIAALLSEAEALLASRRLRKPANDNAYMKYQQVLELEPDNDQALAGLVQIANIYFAMTERAIAAENFDNARAYLMEARVVAPSSPEIQRLEDKLAVAIEVQKEREIQAAAERRAAQIEELLAAARADEQAGRIRAPVGNNALEKYQQILDLDPDHIQAINKLIEYGR
jgi:serine/threonine-protein kinase PpkA